MRTPGCTAAGKAKQAPLVLVLVTGLFTGVAGTGLAPGAAAAAPASPTLAAFAVSAAPTASARPAAATPAAVASTTHSAQAGGMAIAARPAWASPATEQAGSLELLIRVLPDARIMSSCLIELAGAGPEPAAVRPLVDQLQATGLVASEARGNSGWVLSLATAEPLAEVPGFLADGVVVRCEAQRWGPVTIYRAFMSLGGPDGFLRRILERLGRTGLDAAVRLELPGRVISTNAPARAGGALHWDVRTETDSVLLAEAAAFSIGPWALVAWSLGLGLVACLAWLCGDIAVRSARSRHDLRA